MIDGLKSILLILSKSVSTQTMSQKVRSYRYSIFLGNGMLA